CRVCHARVAHLTRIGNSDTPPNTARLPSSSSSAGAPVVRAWNSRNSLSTSATVLPLTASVMVDAQRVVALAAAVGVGQRALVARPAAVVEDELLVQVAQVLVHANTFLTWCSAATSASMSARLEYMPSEARAV